MTIYKCEKGCCKVRVDNYEVKETVMNRNRNVKKAGIMIYDPKEDRILLVQSRGNMWGPPKGTLKPYESFSDGAIREVEEETGLKLTKGDLKSMIKIKNRAVFYYHERDTCDVSFSKYINNTEVNDVNGITWIKLDCLENFIQKGQISLNGYAKIVFYRFMGRIFPNPRFILVRKKRERKKN